MSRKTITTVEISDDRTFSSPVERAFVRIVIERRGISEAQARQIYLDYLDRTELERERRVRAA